MGGPELDQQVVEVPPLLTNWPPDPAHKDTSVGLQGNLLEALGLGGLERRGNPLHMFPPAPKH